MKVRDAADKIVGFIKAQFPMPESDGDMEPALFVFRDGSEEIALVPIGMFLTSDHGKDGLAALIRTLMRNTMVSYVIYVAEAWMIKVQREEGLPEAHIPEGGLKNHPDREEAFFVEAYGREECVTVNIPILRKDGQRTLGEPTYITDKDGEQEGRFSPRNIVPPPQGTVH